MARRSPKAIVQVNLRVPEWLRQRLAREAAEAGRTLNEEMVARILQTFERVDADRVLEQAELLRAIVRTHHQEVGKLLGVPTGEVIASEELLAREWQQGKKK